MIPNATATEVIDAITKRGTATTYYALLTADVVETDTLATMQEITTAGYARKAATFGAPAGDPFVSSQTADVQWAFTADVTTPITTVALVSALSGTTGTIRRTWPLNGNYAPKSGDTLTLKANTLTLGVK